MNLKCFNKELSLHWRHNGRDCVSNHQPYDCLLNRLFRRRSKKTSKLRVTGLCEGNSPVLGEFSAQMASDTENVSIWWRHHIASIGVSIAEIMQSHVINGIFSTDRMPSLYWNGSLVTNQHWYKSLSREQLNNTQWLLHHMINSMKSWGLALIIQWSWAVTTSMIMIWICGQICNNYDVM